MHPHRNLAKAVKLSARIKTAGTTQSAVRVIYSVCKTKREFEQTFHGDPHKNKLFLSLIEAPTSLVSIKHAAH